MVKLYVLTIYNPVGNGRPSMSDKGRILVATKCIPNWDVKKVLKWSGMVTTYAEPKSDVLIGRLSDQIATTYKS